MNYSDIIKESLRMREMSYCPYSGHAVGAALLTKDGRIYTGCNIESATYSPTICAERTAIFKAVSEGSMEFSAIAISGGPKGKNPTKYSFPCGVCRQVMAEFCTDDFIIIVCNSEDEYEVHTLGELLPHSFGKEDMS
ncbi:MAG: cytidine deaminase [Clostridia bacterium]|nr:cytidine deaminase [Clostridia bacterium]